VNKPPQDPPNASASPPPDSDAPAPDAPPSEEEERLAEDLRQALEDASLRSEEAEFARALSSAHAPKAIDEAVHRVLVARAIAARPARRPSVVVRVAFSTGTALALAAGIALVAGSLHPSADRTVALEARPEVPFHSRSTQPLFGAPFGSTDEPGGSSAQVSSGSARIDRIALARASDFRENEFSRWGAR
jgi:hypothetical protein